MPQATNPAHLPGPVSRRLQLLIDRFHGGSVNAAAPIMGIPQRTLARIVAGQSEPKADAVAYIARVYGVPVDWLMTGEGLGPTRDEAHQRPADELAWASVIEQLALPPALNQLLYALPRVIVSAHVNFPYPPRFG
jgi:transcriptional regulator with XRE-family HTH domain